MLEGITARVGHEVSVLYSEGCKITVGGGWYIDDVIVPTAEEDHRAIAEAVNVAMQADVIVLAIGDNEQTSREAWSRKHMGDRASLGLFGRQSELVAAMVATGKPVVALLFNGRPISITDVDATVPAILECWYLGQEAGAAVETSCLAMQRPAARCLSRCRGPSATFLRSTITSRLRGGVSWAPT